MKLNLITTTYKDNVKKTVNENITFIKDDERENELINLYPEVEYQQVEGFGGALTDSAGYVYSLMDDEQKKEMIKLFWKR